jgi:hypothetical protein
VAHIPYTTCRIVKQDHCKLVTCRRCVMVPEERVVQIPYTTCRIVSEEKSEVLRCRRCRLVPEERVCQVPHTTCRLEAHCVTVPVCRLVPVCVPACEPACPPFCLSGSGNHKPPDPADGQVRQAESRREE